MKFDELSELYNNNNFVCKLCEELSLSKFIVPNGIFSK